MRAALRDLCVIALCVVLAGVASCFDCDTRPPPRPPPPLTPMQRWEQEEQR